MNNQDLNLKEMKYPNYNFIFSPRFNQFRIKSALSDNFYYWMGLLSQVNKVGAVDVSLEIPKIKVLSQKKEELRLVILTKWAVASLEIAHAGLLAEYRKFRFSCQTGEDGVSQETILSIL